MEIKNGIVINGEFHEAIKVNEQVISCNDCSLKPMCYKIVDSLCGMLDESDKFVNRGKVTVIPSRETPENTGSIYRNGVKIEKEK